MIPKNKKAVWLGALFTLIFAFLLNSFVQAKENLNEQDSESNAKEKLSAYIKFTQILNLIEKQYVDDVNTTNLVNKALKGLMTNLDAHSTYMDAKAFKELTVHTTGEFGGLGISIGMKDSALTVIAPIEGTPADKAGIQAGDIILRIDSNATLGMSIDESVNLMRGKPGTEIELTIIREGEPKPLQVKIVRDIIKIQSVFVKTIEEDLLYIHITSFDQKVISGVKEALKEHKNYKGIILDLRNNPGGLLDQAVGVVDLFVKKGDIVSQKGRTEGENVTYKATKKSMDLTTPIVVLVNGGSASASEIVSGALQDFKRAIVIGEKTFGKGSVQVVLPINSEEAIKLTVARYYLPSGRTIQAEGVTPDIIVHLGKIEYKEDPALLKERDLKKHLQTVKSEESKKSTKENKKKQESSEEEDNATEGDKTIITEEQLYKDAQLKSAVDIVKALIITQKKNGK
jgi:carboxyl-terminal processing protease